MQVLGLFPCVQYYGQETAHYRQRLFASGTI